MSIVGEALRSAIREELRLLIRKAVREALQDSNAVVETSEPMRRPNAKYKGDCMSKKAVRLRVWELVCKTLDLESRVAGPHMFLASAEGGDASVLRGLGISDSAMIAVDWDGEAAASFSAVYSNIRTEVTDVAHLLCERPSFASVYLDFTAQVSGPLVDRVLKALKSVIPGGIVACTFSFGREKGALRWRSQASACEPRMQALENFIRSRLGYQPEVLARMSYQSRSVSGHGSNMGVLVLRAKAAEPSSRGPTLHAFGLYDFYRDVALRAADPNLHLLLNCSEEKTAKLRARVAWYPPPSG